MSEQQSKPQGGQSPQNTSSQPQGIPGSSLSGASVESASAAGDEVGRQSGQQREHGHMSREDQEHDKGAGGAGSSSGTDRLAGHPDTSESSVHQGRNGGTGEDSGRP